MSATAWAFGESLSAMQVAGALIVMLGLAVAVALPGLLARRAVD
jgi:drug/metabolite transporter (DMT)-like permease